MTRILSSLLLALLLAGFASARELRNSRNEVVDIFPPPRLESVPSFFVPAAGQSLDEGWVFDTVLADAALTRPDLFNAYPVDLVFNRAGRGFLAMLHTVFYTTDGGDSWQNMDPFPPPGTSVNWTSLRGGAYITGLDVWPSASDSINNDSLFLSASNVLTDTGTVRLITYFGAYTLGAYANSLVKKGYWLTGIEIVDPMRGVAFGGMNRTVLYNDTLLGRLPSGATYTTSWDSIPHLFWDGWLAGKTANTGGLLYAVGTRQWISWDAGATWNDYAPVDSMSDYGVAFSDSMHGLVGGGTISPSRGWVHRTENAGFLWSGRTLNISQPIRALDMIDDTLGYAAGGLFDLATGQISVTTDGGLTWNQDLAVNAEIRTIGHVRVNAAYVDIFAAGAFPDYRCGIWRKRLFLPDRSSALLMATPDTLQFGTHNLNAPDTLYTTLHNYGIAPITINGINGGDNRLYAVFNVSSQFLAPNDSVVIPMVLTANTVGTFFRIFNVANDLNQRVSIYCRGEVIPDATTNAQSLLPEQTDMTVWPNPGNHQFRIQFTLAQTAVAEVKIYDLSGRLTHTLSSQQLPAGEHIRSWNAEGLSSGVYFVRLITPTGTVTRKVLLLK